MSQLHIVIVIFVRAAAQTIFASISFTLFARLFSRSVDLPAKLVSQMSY